MNNPTRRSFLGGALTLVAVTAIPKGLLVEALPVLYGDGVHCDAAGVEALAAGKPFRTLDGFCGTARDGELIGANLLFKRGVNLECAERGFLIMGCHITREVPYAHDKSALVISGKWKGSDNG